MSNITNSKKIKVLACFSCAFLLFLVSSCKKKEQVVSSSSSSSPSTVEVSTSSTSSPSSVASIVTSSDSSNESSSINSNYSVSSSENSSVVSSESSSESIAPSSSIDSVSSNSSSIDSSISSSISSESSNVVTSNESSASSSSSISSSDSASIDSSSSVEALLDFDESVKMVDKVVSYDGNAHKIVVEGAPEGTTITYKDGKNSYVDAGIYTIEATLEKEGYNTKKLTATLTIERIDIDIENIVINNVKTQYDSKNKYVTVEGLPTGVTPSIKYYTDEAHTNEVSSTKEAGKYYAVISFNVGKNYNRIDDMYGTVEITKKTYDISNISINDIVYNATVLTKDDIVIANLPKSLSVSDVKFYATNTSMEEIDVIDAGTYYASVTFANDNSTYYEDVQPIERMEFNVLKKEVQVNWNNLSVTYNGKAQSPTFDLGTAIIDGDEVNVKFVGEATIRVGTYDVSVQLEGKDASNYELKNGSTQFTINSPNSIVEIKSKEQFTDGYYVFTYNQVAFLAEKIDGKNSGRVNGVSFGDKLSYDSFELNRLWYIEKEGDNYYIKAPNGKYLTSNDKGFKLSETKIAWTMSTSEFSFINGTKTIRYNNSMKQFGWYPSTSCDPVNCYKINNYCEYNITVNELDSSLGTAQIVSSTGSFEELYSFDKITITGTVAEGKILEHVKVGDTEYEFEYDNDTREFRCEFTPSVSGTLLIEINDAAREREVTITQVDNLTITAENKYIDREDVTITVTPDSDDYYVKEVIIKDSDGNNISTTKNGNEYSFTMANGKDITITAVAGRKYLVNITANEDCNIVLKDENDNIYDNNTKIPDNVRLIVDVDTIKPYYAVTSVRVNDEELVEEDDVYSFDVTANATISASVSLINETSIVDIPNSKTYNGQYYLSSGIISSLGSNSNNSSFLLDYSNRKSELQLYKFGNSNEYSEMKSAGITTYDYLIVYGEYELYNSKRELKSVLVVDYVGKINNLSLDGDKIVWNCNYASSYDVYNGEELVAEGLTKKEFALTDEMKMMDVTVNFRVVAHGKNNYLSSNAELSVTYLKSYSITYVYNDGVREDVTTNKMIAIPESLEELNRNGYAFLGWFTDSGCTNKVTLGEKLTENVTLYAGWQKVYNVTYVYNDGSTPNKDLNNQTVLPENLEQPTRNGYIFGGWYSDDQLNNIVEGGLTLSSDITLYAKWLKAHLVTVKENKNIEVINLDSKGYVEGDFIEFSVKAKEGYRIEGVEAKVNGDTYGEVIYVDGTVILTIPSDDVDDVEITVTVVRTYNVSIEENENFTIAWAYDNNYYAKVDEGTTIEILFEAKEGWSISKVLVNDVEVTLNEEGSYTISNIDKDYVIKVVMTENAKN